MLRVLVTGYSGFVGSHLVKVLSGHYELKLLGRKPAEVGAFYQANIDADSCYREALKDTDTVIHAAAKAHVMSQSQKLNSEYEQVNLQGALNLAKQAAECGVKRFIFVSTIKAIGGATFDGKQFRHDSVCNPGDHYALSKYRAEEQLKELAAKTDIEVVIIRPPLVYGQGVKGNFMTLMKAVRKRLPMPLRMVNDNRKSMVSVYNLIDLIKTTIESPHARNNTFLVSDDHDLSTAQLWALMAKTAGVQNTSLPFPTSVLQGIATILGKGEAANRLLGSLAVDIEHTKQVLGWRPPYSVEEGLRKTFFGNDHDD